MRLFLSRSARASAPEIIGGIFVAQRSALKALDSHALAGSGLTPEIAGLLLELFLAAKEGSSSGNADAAGYVPVQHLLAAVSYTPGLLSRRLTSLGESSWIETKRATANPAAGVHGNCRKVRITELGKAKIAPVWKKFVQQSEDLLAGVSASDLAAHHRVNKMISERLGAPQFHPHEITRPVVRAQKQPEPAAEAFPKSQLVQFEKEFLD